MKLALLTLLLVLSQPVLYEEGIALVSGESWHLHQGYTIAVRGVDIEGSLVWVDIRLNNTTVASRVVPLGSMLGIYRNGGVLLSVYGTQTNISDYEQNTTATRVMLIEVTDIYTGTYQDMVLFKVTQYTDPFLPLTTPLPSSSSPSSIGATPPPPQPTAPQLAGWWYGAALSVLVLLWVLFRRRLK
ncbi:S-layer protein domain-containing protein [Methermicoccus shengliensis]|uniref:S-layer family duplication domain-containing protein n=1 Tax=Methermicoccus shengliensis TaxID=660064 RepID=A0A832RVF2_9EURY|nr:S-layer protein domain-containing protein [Methermicoccus shengliensis]KUK04503.1 MAG: hypothetical protein XD46_0821 [Euryarchaeota archaeon 55_53]KUK29775.1 MAG: hypothetical protein XD62_1131 [Methanosarcinales archeaon 56_1174]MDI3487454.1 S-layer protein [Methanosarcinales archaeon]HIH69204.1 hypothetical protein [Methermicoccus shengliensis]